MSTNHQKYPIGWFEKPVLITPIIWSTWISTISAFPDNLFQEVENLSDQQLNTMYREDGWTVRQVVHHCADSHMNAFIRFKLAMTEESPTIKPYFEDRWAELLDGKTASVLASIQILRGLHYRWTVLLKSLNDKDLQKTYIHPEHGNNISLEEAAGMYAWHCSHHLAHITTLKKMKNWR